MTKPRKGATPPAKRGKDAPSTVRPRVTPESESGGSIGNKRDSRRGRDLTPAKDNDPDRQERKA